jgi:hypothetical protein
MPSLIGNKPNQVPSNGDLGTLAFQDSNAVNLTGGTAVIDNLTADAINLKVDTDISNIAPSLNLDFANSKTLDPRITYTRASTATYYDGVTTAKAEENLLTYSQDIDNAAWIKTASTVTANSTTAPDGTTTADTLTGNGTNTYHWVAAPSGTVIVGRTFSVFAKAGTNNFIQFLIGGDTSVYANFDISTGTVGNTGGTGTVASMVSVGSGWYRCIIYTPSATGTNFYISLVTSNTAIRAEANTLSTDVYLWGAQLEQRSAVSAYTPTTTAPITNYIPVLRTAASGVARFEHNPITGESLGLEIEESRTNLSTYSEQFDNGAWSKSNATISAETIVAPDGTLTGDAITTTATTAAAAISNGKSVTAIAYTQSVYAKTGSYPYLWVGDRGDAVIRSATFDLSTGTITGSFNITSAAMTPVGNGWYRCSITFTRTNAGTTSNMFAFGASTAALDRPSGITWTGTESFYIWGAQLEAGAFATSYIPTVASQVTRAADAASMTGTNFSSWYNAAEGTVYVEAGLNRAFDVGRGTFDINDGTTANRLTLSTQGATSNSQAFVGVATATQALITNTGAFASGTAKVTLVYKRDDFASSANGATPVIDTSGVLPVVDRAAIGSITATSNILCGTIKKLQYFPKRLPNAELVEMTS